MKKKTQTKRRRGLILGKGVVDVEYRTQRFDKVDGKRKLVWTCPYYRTWKEMIRRVYSKKLHDKFPTYKGCTVADKWLSLSCFKDWMEQQEWEEDGKLLQLDKDFIKKGNKHYSPETCCFLPHAVNSFCKEKPNFAMNLPLGVHLKTFQPSGNQAYCATCLDPFKRNPRHIGYFKSPEAAHSAWKKRKHQYACELADSHYVKDERVANTLRNLYK